MLQPMKAVVGLVACLGLALGCVVHCDAQTAPEAGAKLRPEIDKFIAYMAETHGFNARDLRALFAKVQPSQDVTRAMTAPSTAKPWYEFKPLFVDQARISAGVKFWNDNAEVLAQARGEFGVPEAIVVALIGVETRYGRNSGGFRVMDTLTTLAFDWPSRRDFFRRELEQFLLLAREQGWDPLMIKGSFAGAMGMPQFMPGSYRRYAVDFDGSGEADLRASPSDAIGSVANFLEKHGWQRGERVQLPARVAGDAPRPLVDAGIEPKTSLGELKRYGVETRTDLPLETPVSLIELESPGAPTEYRLGLRNFYVLTRYNRSVLYASTVCDLAEEIKAKR